MVPAYALTALLFLSSLRQLLGKKAILPIGWGHKIANGIGLSFGWVIFAIAAALPALFPVFQLPKPGGEFMVGTTSFVFIDNSRPETFTPDPDNKRLIYVQVWYPAEPTVGAGAGRDVG